MIALIAITCSTILYIKLSNYLYSRSINGIFLFDGLSSVYPHSELEYGFDDLTWTAITSECKNEYPLTLLPKKTETIINKFAKVINPHFEKLMLFTN